MWRRNLDYKDSQETQSTSIDGISKYDSVVDKNGIHYDEKQDEYVKEYIDGHDEEEYNDDGRIEKECLFLNLS